MIAKLNKNWKEKEMSASCPYKFVRQKSESKEGKMKLV